MTAMLVYVDCEYVTLLHRIEVVKSAQSCYYMWSVNHCDTSSLQLSFHKCKLMFLNSQNVLPDCGA